MLKNKRLPKFNPQVIKDKNNKVKSVLLKYSVYEAILERMDYLKQNIARLKQKAALKKLKDKQG
jgi:uncharacterized small protein (DUF1192 family)